MAMSFHCTFRPQEGRSRDFITYQLVGVALVGDDFGLVAPQVLDLKALIITRKTRFWHSNALMSLDKARVWDSKCTQFTCRDE